MSKVISTEQSLSAAPAAPLAVSSWWKSEEAIGIVLIIASVTIPTLFGSYWSHIFLLLNLFLVAAISQNLLLADAGQVSFGQGAIFGIAAYTVGIVSGLNGYPLWLGLLAGIAAGIVLGVLYALPALRVKGFYLGFVTMAAATVMPEMLNAFSDITNGINGIGLVSPWFGEPLLFSITRLEVIIAALSLATLLAHSKLRKTRLGRRMRVAAISPETALTLGYRPGVVRSVAFLIAAVGTSLAGILYGPVVGFLSPEAFLTDLSIFFFFAVIVGGSGYLIGPIVGVAILYLVPNVLLVDLVEYRLLGYGFTALLIMFVFPDGVVGTLEKFFRKRSANARSVNLNLAPLLEHKWQLAAASAPAQQDGALAVEVLGAARRYGQVKALDGVDFKVKPKSIHGLVGPNGSGKTTLLNILSGLSRLDQGSIRIFGSPVDTTTASDISRAGLARTFQTPRIFDDLTVWENLQIGLDSNTGDSLATEDAFGAIRDALGRSRPDTLPHAQRRALEVMRCVARGPRLLLLDEPAAGLSKEERGRFADLLRRLREELDLTIILVEHDLGLVWQVADAITVLDAGRVVIDGPPQDVVNSAEVQKLFSGK